MKFKFYAECSSVQISDCLDCQRFLTSPIGWGAESGAAASSCGGEVKSQKIADFFKN